MNISNSRFNLNTKGSVNLKKSFFLIFFNSKANFSKAQIRNTFLSFVFFLIAPLSFAQVTFNITKSTPTTTIGPGGFIVYTINYQVSSNTDPIINNVVITDVLSPYLGGFSLFTGVGTSSMVGNTAIFNLGNLAAGTTGVVTISTQVQTNALPNSNIENTATISADGTPSISSNTVSTLITGNPGIQFFKTFKGTSGLNITQGGTGTFGFYLSNNGNVNLPNICIVDTLPFPDKMSITSFETGNWGGFPPTTVMRIEYQTNLSSIWTQIAGSPFNPPCCLWTK